MDGLKVQVERATLRSVFVVGDPIGTALVYFPSITRRPRTGAANRHSRRNVRLGGVSRVP
jgi:hypothetical protein